MDTLLVVALSTKIVQLKPRRQACRMFLQGGNPAAARPEFQQGVSHA
jgi:hypothetical protein